MAGKAGNRGYVAVHPVKLQQDPANSFSRIVNRLPDQELGPIRDLRRVRQQNHVKVVLILRRNGLVEYFPDKIDTCERTETTHNSDDATSMD